MRLMKIQVKAKRIDRLADLLYLFNREQLKIAAEKLGTQIGRDKCDAVHNIIRAFLKVKDDRKFDDAIITISVDIPKGEI